MSEKLNAAIMALKQNYGAEDCDAFRQQNRLLVSPEKLLAACTTLRDEHGFEMLMGASCVDYWPEQTPRFHAVLQFASLKHKMRLELRVPLEGNQPELESLTRVYPNAEWYEREMYDMFGVRFSGHPDLRRILMPADWQGPPLRKDYPLGYEEVEFSFNYEEIEMKKPRPKD